MEVELKLLLDPEHAPALRGHPLLAQYATGAPVVLSMHDIYFDTSDLRLCRQQAGLRVRRVDDDWIQTMKAGGTIAGGLHSRNEWEGPVDGPEPDLDALRKRMRGKNPWRALLREPEIRDGLRPVFSTRIERSVWQLRLPQGDAIECVLDQGSIISGEHSIAISEVELELKAGRADSLFELALALLQDLPLQVGQMSKAERGYRLAAGMPLAAVKAPALALDAFMTAQQAFQAIATHCLQHMLDNQAGVTAGDVESLHQMRVGLRRLRSALQMFKALLALPDELRRELDWLAQALSAARDWDVLAGDTLARLEEGEDCLAPLQQAARVLAQDYHGQAGRAVASPRATRLFLSLTRWLQAAGWRDTITSRQRRRLDVRVPRFARQALLRSQRRLLTRGKYLLRLAPPARHRVRIAAKKARYATEFFASLYDADEVKSYVKWLSVLQDELGWRNDNEVADGLLRALAEMQPDLLPQAAYARGFLAAQLQGGAGKALARPWRRYAAALLPSHVSIADA